MGFIEIVIIGVGLAMDAFAVSICKGLSTRKLEVKHALICGGYFGFFSGNNATYWLYFRGSI